MKKVAIIGTQGVPARYGGFETLVENIIGDNCSEDIQYTVFCSSKDLVPSLKTYKGANLIYIPVKANGMQSTIYDIISLIKSIRGYDVIVVLGVSGCVFLPFFRLFCRKKLIINIDGLEWKRDKWGGFAKWFLRLSEGFALRFSDVVIADNQGIVDYVKTTYKKDSVLIAYGSDHVRRDVSEERQRDIFKKFDVDPGKYYISICRIEPENNCELILETFAHTDKKLIFIGNWERSLYGQRLKTKYSQFNNISIIDPVYDLEVLYVLRNNSKTYVHGHSAGGTNPSLVEAMFCKCNIMAYDVVYNRETTDNKALYFKNGIDLALAITNDAKITCNSEAMYKISEQRYTWKKIAKQYEDLY